jgi:ATP-binding cassette, subfamily B, bacterial PglK
MKIRPEYNKLRKLFNRSERIKIGMLFGMMLLAAFLELLGIGMIPAFVAIVADPARVLKYNQFSELYQLLNINNSRDLLIYGGLILIGVYVLKNTYIMIYYYIEARFIFNRRYTFSHKLMTAYMQAPYTFYLERNSSELLRNTNNEVNIMINNVLLPILKVSKELIMGILVVAFLLFAEPTITLIISVVMGGMAGSFLYITRERMNNLGIEAQEYRKGMLKAAQQGFGGIKDARVLNREGEFIETFREMAYQSSQLQLKKTFISSIPRPTVETLSVGGIILIAIIMVLQERPISSIVPIIAMFGVAIVRLIPAINQVTQLLTDLQFNIASVNPVYDDLTLLKDNAKAFRSDRRKKQKLELRTSIVIDNLHYQYPKSTEQALNGVNLEIPFGSAVAFVGSSGSGKTTLADSLLGLLVPQKGAILVDDVNISESISSWQQNIGYIPQFIYLSDDTLKRNIAFGLPDDKIDDEKILKAVELSQLSDLIEHLPQGIETVIGERGTRLSGGQRQRVGIARALYHEPQVLVMDEATSALDNITEQQIIEAIEALKGNRTVIMIAHRLTTVMNCDMLFFMENGRIVDKGTYQELLIKNADFREMAREISVDNKTADE